MSRIPLVEPEKCVDAGPDPTLMYTGNILQTFNVK
jgi:hypothetical protein